MILAIGVLLFVSSLGLIAVRHPANGVRPPSVVEAILAGSAALMGLATTAMYFRQLSLQQSVDHHLVGIFWGGLILVASVCAIVMMIAKKRSPGRRVYGLLATLLSILVVLAGFSIGKFLIPSIILILLAGLFSASQAVASPAPSSSLPNDRTLSRS